MTPTDTACEDCLGLEAQFSALVSLLLVGLAEISPQHHHHRTAAINLVLDTLTDLGVAWVRDPAA